jgi:nucleotide-binding universal stress UspA family protein
MLDRVEEGSDMFRRIIVPLDGSVESNSALPVARTLARGTGSSVTLLRVRSRGESTQDLTAALERIARELASSEVQVRAVVRDGQPAHEILDEVRAQDAGLVIMRTHGRSGIERAVLGSTAQQVLAATHVPIVFVRPGERRLDHLRTMLVPLDGSPGGAIGLGAAVGLAQATGAALRLLEVVIPIPMYIFESAAWSGGVFVDPAWDAEGLAAAQAYVASIGARLAERVSDVKGEAIMSRSVGEAIVRRASEQSVDLIVMSSHALTGVARAVLGSVADEVVRKADCPVLVVHASDRAAQPAATSDPAGPVSQEGSINPASRHAQEQV